MTDQPTRSTTSYSTKDMADAKRTLMLDQAVTLDYILKLINTGKIGYTNGATITKEQWWAQGKQFYEHG